MKQSDYKNNASFDDYINYRLESAGQSYKDARLLFENGSYNACVNRLYYSVFYAVIALLLKSKIEIKSHDGARRMFGKYFVNTSFIDQEFGKLYSKLFDWRERGDYGDLFDFSEKEVEPLFQKVAEMLDAIKNLLIR
jgi:uncharacterized protein (UPF0332 family)